MVGKCKNAAPSRSAVYGSLCCVLVVSQVTLLLIGRPIVELLEDTFVPKEDIIAFNGQCDYLGDAKRSCPFQKLNRYRPRPTCVGPSYARSQRMMVPAQRERERPSLSPHPVSQLHQHVRREVLTQWNHS